MTEVLAVLAVAVGCMVWGWLQLRGAGLEDPGCGDCQLCEEPPAAPPP